MKHWEAQVFTKGGCSLNEKSIFKVLHGVRFAVKREKHPRLNEIDFLSRCFIKGLQDCGDCVAVSSVCLCK